MAGAVFTVGKHDVVVRAVRKVAPDMYRSTVWVPQQLMADPVDHYRFVTRTYTRSKVTVWQTPTVRIPLGGNGFINFKQILSRGHILMVRVSSTCAFTYRATSVQRLTMITSHGPSEQLAMIAGLEAASDYLQK